MNKKEDELKRKGHECCMPKLTSDNPEKEIRDNESDHTPFD